MIIYTIEKLFLIFINTCEVYNTPSHYYSDYLIIFLKIMIIFYFKTKIIFK
jgi:hypothetical protein